MAASSGCACEKSEQWQPALSLLSETRVANTLVSACEKCEQWHPAQLLLSERLAAKLVAAAGETWRSLRMTTICEPRGGRGNKKQKKTVAALALHAMMCLGLGPAPLLALRLRRPRDA